MPMMVSNGAEIAVAGEVFQVRVYRDDAGNHIAEARRCAGKYGPETMPVVRALGRSGGEAFTSLVRAVQLRALRSAQEAS